MRTVKCVLNGVTYELPANNSGEISNSEMDIDPTAIEVLKNLPRVGTTGKGLPIVQDDNGKKLYLRATCLKQEGDGSCHSYVSNGAPRGSLPKPKAWEDLPETEQAAWEEVKKACMNSKSAAAAFEIARPKTRDELAKEAAKLAKERKIAALQAQLAELLGE